MSSTSDNPYVDRLNIGVGRRTLAILLALFIEVLLLVLLFSFNTAKPPASTSKSVTVVSLPAAQMSAEAPAEQTPEPPSTSPRPDEPQPTPERPQPTEPLVQIPPAVLPPQVTVQVPTAAEPPSPPAPPRPPSGQVYGPPNRGGSSSSDTARVGTAPNGEPMYAAAWYREPRPDELRGYLSTASGPGWGLITCRTAPDFRVEDCVALEESPAGSQINRAVLAAAWQFRVRPPRVGGRTMVGAWVRIRIDYDNSAR